MFSSLKKIVGTISPLLGGALGGPLGGLAGSMIQKALGVDSEEAAISMLESDPESLLKIKELETNFETKMRELGIDEQRIHAEDRQSARDMAKVDMSAQKMLSALFVGGYFLIFISVLSGYLTPQEGMKDMALILLGVLAGEVPRIMAFWFGSSLGSKEKTAVMAKNGGKGS
jgi:hypothetical protein